MRDSQQSRGIPGRRLSRRIAAHRAQARPTLEALEDRRLFAGTTPIISEFLAINDTGIQDEDSNRSDWIEVHNPTASDVNLDGYYLTDDATLMNKWRFPAVTLPSGGYMVVWASGKNRAVAGAPLHTNFNLDGTLGEYLALVAPDGTTPLTQFNPFPPQSSDVSYGVSTSQQTTSLIGQRATARTKVPTATDNLGLTWTSPTFNDAPWTAGTTGVGYETDSPPPPTPGFRVRMVDVGNGTRSDISTVDDAAAILNSTDGTAGGAYTLESDTSVVKSIINMAPGGAYGADEALPNGAADGTMYALRATATVTIPAGQWTINVNSDDGFRLKMPGVTFITPNNGQISPADTFQFAGLRGPANSFVTFTVPAGGVTVPLQLDFFENQGGDNIELAIASGFRTSFSTTTFSLLGNTVLGWTVSDPITVGPPNYRSLIGTDVQAQMFNGNTSAYIRVPFSVAAAGDYDSLRLQMKYDDGFVAYLNGTEVARRNAPTTLAYNSQASVGHPDDQALVYESMSVPASALRTGSNVLAIQGLNVLPTSSDFLIQPELQGFKTQVGTTPAFYAKPTPGLANTTPAFIGVVADTKFDHDRGFYDAPIQVAITTATEGAEIRYTTNGDTPTATTGTVYSGPITVDKTTTLRAAAFKPGYVPANTDTQTYLFLDDVIHQSDTAAPGPGWPAPGAVNGQIINYGMDPNIVNSATWGPQLKTALTSIPTFSIVTDLKNLFDVNTGIYTHPSGDERAWERPASVELIYPDGTKGFQIDAGLRVRGGFSRDPNNPKHAFRLFFRSDYGGRLKYPMFGPTGAQSFAGFDLRTTQNYSWAYQGDRGSIFMRDQFSRDTQLAMGQPAERGNWYHLYIDGQYWGLYNTDERPEANYGQSYFGGASEDYDVIKVDPDLGYNIEATDGNFDAWNQLYQILKGPVDDNVLQQVQGNSLDGTPDPTKPVLLDIDNLIDYMLVIYYGGNLDAPISNFIGNTSPNNFFAVRNRNLAARQGFQFFSHDAEHTFLDVNQNRLGPSVGTGWPAGDDGVNKSNPQWFFQRLWASPEFKLRVADHVQKHLVNADGALAPANVRARLLARKAEINLAVIAESARWGDSKTEPPITKSDFDNAWNNVLNGYVPARTNIVIGQLRQWGLFPSLNAPRYSQQGGQVPIGYQLSILAPISAPAGTSIYYTLDGSDPRGRNGNPAPAAILYTAPITINDTTVVKARALNIDANNVKTWSAVNVGTFTIDLAAIRITELMYNPAPAPAGSTFNRDDFEFVELMNTGVAERDLSGAKIAGGIDFTFAQNFKLAPGARLIVAKNVAAFRSRYGDTPGITVVGPYGGQLSDGGELLRIESATGQVSSSFTYNDAWYPQTDGEGFSLNILNPAGPISGWNVKQSWNASNRIGGTPGLPDDSPPIGAVSVNEVLATPEAGSATGDFIEIKNTTAADIDVSGWFLSDSATNLKRFSIPTGTILAANGLLAFYQAQLGFDIAPNLAGEIFVSAGDTAGNILGYRESKRYGVGDEGFSFGEHVKSTGGTDFVAMASPTPGAPNGSPRVGPIVINELMFYPPSFATEYLELRNLTGSDIVLNDPADPTSAWKFAGDLQYAFPAGAVVPAFGFALIIPGDEAAFRSVYDVPPGVRIYGGLPALDNVKENVALYRPTAAGDILVDRVNYDFTPGAAPWPGGAADSGSSIARFDGSAYGNDAANWRVETLAGTPARTNLDTVGPTADVVDVAPDPRTTPVASITIVFNEPVNGLDLSDVKLTRDGGANLLTGAQSLTSTDRVTWTLSGLSGLTAAPGAYSLTVGGAAAGIVDWGGNGMSAIASEAWRVGGIPNGRIVGRHLFYNASTFDGFGAAASTSDDNAIATDKLALLPGQAATFASYSNYSRGINGVMVDVSGLLADLTAADFAFKVGNDVDPGAWVDAPAPLAVTRRRGAGVNGSDRVTIVWPDGAVRNQWLRVTVLANGNTGLPSADVFYFGNLAGEIGDAVGAAAVTATDVMAVRAAIGATAAGITRAADFNRDGRINAADLAIARGGVGTALTLLTAPAAPAIASATIASATIASATIASATIASATASVATSPFGQTMIEDAPAARSRPARRSSLSSESDVLGRA